MARIQSGCIIWLSYSLLMLPVTAAQARDHHSSDLTLEVSQLKSKIADQEERIAQLEKALRALQDSSARTGNIAEAILKFDPITGAHTSIDSCLALSVKLESGQARNVAGASGGYSGSAN